MKVLIRKQVDEEVVNDEFDVGYLQGSNVITMRNKEDIMELWSTLLKGSNTVICCDRLLVQQSTSRKRPSLDTDSDDEDRPKMKKKKDEKESAVKKYIEDLNANHKQKYTTCNTVYGLK